MAKNKVIGKCALCKSDDVELQNSHIISRLVYTRMKCYENSRFRNYYDINKIYQDGEKKYILCKNCEQFFSKFEVSFTNKFLDKYIKKGIKSNEKISEYEDFIYSLSWRILYDDLYILNSFKNEQNFIRDNFIEMEEKIKEYLNSKLEKSNSKQNLEEFKNYILFLDEFNLDKDIINLLTNGCYGYCFSSDCNRKYIVIICFLGVVCVTTYEPKNFIVINTSLKDMFRIFGRNNINKIIRNELVYQYNNMLKHKSNNDKILSSGLEKKIRDRYEK